MRRLAVGIAILMLLFGLFSACGARTAVYRYDNEDVFDIKIEKTVVYPNKLEVKLSKGSLSDVQKVVCFDSDFSVLEEDAEFSFANDVLTIHTEHADSVSGLEVMEAVGFLYFSVRYLDSDSYAMLVYPWATDIGYMTFGDEEAYYTQAEKDRKKELAQKLEEAEALTFGKLLGEWINEKENTRIVFSVDADGDRSCIVYELAEQEWIECDSMYISYLTEEDRGDILEINLYDNPHWGRVECYLLTKDASQLKCFHSDEIFVKAD